MKSAHRSASRAKRSSTGRWQADPSAFYRLMNKLQPFKADELAMLNVHVRLAFERIRIGNGQDEHFHTLATAINVAMIRSETIDPLCLQTCQLAQASLMRCIDRHYRLGVWGFDGLALQDIPPAIDLHEQILALSTPLQMQDAMAETLVRMQRGDIYATTPSQPVQ
jgi:hypothetical protein